MCAFLVCACSDPNQNSIKPHKEESLSNGLHHDSNAEINKNDIPLLTLQELLNASDVKNALSVAASNNNESSLIIWRQKLIQAADEVNLDDSERVLLEGEQGLKYLAFQGMKFNYQKDFQTAFVNFEDVTDLYKAYPDFKDLKERSMNLIEQRDMLIESVAKELTEQNFEGNAVEEAKRQWQAYIRSQADFSQ